jgi:hypothetical protein
MIKIMRAKYPGRCSRTGVPIRPGDEIAFDTATRTAYITCEDDAQEINTITLNDQGRYRTFTRNARGRCEDAPCCGCCTI